MSPILTARRHPTSDDDADLDSQRHPDDVEWVADCYRAYANVVRRYVARYVAASEVDDVTQQVFFELWRSSGRYDPSRDLRTWLLGIARKRAIDQIRRSRSAASVARSYLEDLEDVPGVDGRETADRIVAATAVAHALDQLSAPQSEVLRLAYFDGYSQTEIARLLAIPLGTVKTRTSRGLQRLARALDERP